MLLFLEYDERFLNGSKKLHYKRAIVETFSPYSNVYGLVKQSTLYSELDYSGATVMWQWYRNRDDFLESIETDFEAGITYESYGTGRPDSLRRNNLIESLRRIPAAEWHIAN